MRATAVAPGIQPGDWRVSWRMRNLSEKPLTIEEVWQPHGKFRGTAQTLTLPPLAPGAEARFELPVRFAEEPGTEVENAFLILRVVWGNQPWRVLARLLVTAKADGRPRVKTVLVTTQPVGFGTAASAG